MTEKPSLAQRWDARYAEKDALWSGEINPTFRSAVEEL